MSKALQEMASIYYGKSPSEVIDADGPYPIVGTGGEYGRAVKPLFSTGVVVPRKGSLGNPQLVEQPFWPTDTTYAVVVNSDIDVRWLYYNLLNYDLTKLNEATGVPSISRDWLSRLKFYDPGYVVQRKIAYILQAIDQTIEKTAALIEKYQQIKAGLMHDLFTRGIGADGHLRPPREQAPELYQQTPIGWIPKEWDITSLGKLYAEPARNGLYKPAVHHGRGPFMVQMGNMFRGMDVDFEGAGRVEVTSSELATYGLQEGDLLFGRRSLVLEGAGKCALVKDLPEPSTFESSIIRVRVNRYRLSPDFAALFLSSAIAYLDRRRFIRQVAVSGISGADLKQFTMLLPSPSEQVKICETIQSADFKLRNATALSEKLSMQKSGLMHDLLTGKVHVKLESKTSEMTGG